MDSAEKISGLRLLGRRAHRIMSLLWAFRLPGAALVQASHEDRSLALRARSQHILRTHGLQIVHTGQIPTSTSLLLGNHLGYLDPVMISSVCNCCVVAKQELTDWPLFGRTMKLLGVLFVKRESPMSGAIILRQALRVLKSDTSVLIFPEGTTTNGEKVLPFKRGAFGLSMLAKIPVVPITIKLEDPAGCWIDDDSFGRHYLEQAGKLKTRVHIHFHPAMNAQPKERAEEFAERARRLVEQKLQG